MPATPLRSRVAIFTPVTVRASSLERRLAVGQGLFYAGTGVWPLVYSRGDEP